MIVFLFSERIPGIRKGYAGYGVMDSMRPHEGGQNLHIPSGGYAKNSKHCLCTDTGKKIDHFSY